MKIQREAFGKLQDGREVDLYTITNKDGSELQITNYGAAIVSLKVPDRNGKMESVVLGFDSLRHYEKFRHFYGAIVGRYANRLNKGIFSLNGTEYQLAANDGDNHLHGGIMGFDRVVWETGNIFNANSNTIKLSYLSKDMEEGYPGNLSVTVTYTFSEDHELTISYEIKTDKPTIKNVSNHAYFNLSGNLKENILGHELMLNADYFLPVKPGLIPTGEIRDVRGTPMDFLQPHKIGERINENYNQLEFGLGYDHNWILKDDSSSLDYAGYVYEPLSGRRMDVYTTEPGIQFYSGNFMDGTYTSAQGIAHDYRYAMCLETQHYPDSPNHPEFPSTVLNPGAVYNSKTVYKFSVK
jgi:aldose 1-epimerase